MTTTETTSPYSAATPTGQAAPATTPRGNVLASAVAVFLGGYILVQSLSGQITPILAGYGGGPDLLPLFLGQLLFALAVVIFGLFLAPATLTAKLVGSALVVVGSVIMLAVQVARITTGFGGVPASLTLANAYFMVALFVGAAWLVVRSARVGWLSLLAAAVLIPLPFLFAFNGVPTAITQPVLLVVLGIVGVVILLGGRARRVS